MLEPSIFSELIPTPDHEWSTLEHLQNKRLEYNILMKRVLDGRLHCKKKDDEEVTYPLSDIQKFKNNCLYKYYEYQYNKYDKLIYEEITSNN